MADNIEVKVEPVFFGGMDTTEETLMQVELSPTDIMPDCKSGFIKGNDQLGESSSAMNVTQEVKLEQQADEVEPQPVGFVDVSKSRLSDVTEASAKDPLRLQSPCLSKDEHEHVKDEASPNVKQETAVVEFISLRDDEDASAVLDAAPDQDPLQVQSPCLSKQESTHLKHETTGVEFQDNEDSHAELPTHQDFNQEDHLSPQSGMSLLPTQVRRSEPFMNLGGDEGRFSHTGCARGRTMPGTRTPVASLPYTTGGTLGDSTGGSRSTASATAARSRGEDRGQSPLAPTSSGDVRGVHTEETPGPVSNKVTSGLDVLREEHRVRTEQFRDVVRQRDELHAIRVREDGFWDEAARSNARAAEAQARAADARDRILETLRRITTARARIVAARARSREARDLAKRARARFKDARDATLEEQLLYGRIRRS